MRNGYKQFCTWILWVTAVAGFTAVMLGNILEPAWLSSIAMDLSNSTALIILGLLGIFGIAALNPFQWRYNACIYATVIAGFSLTSIMWTVLYEKLAIPTISVGVALVFVALIKAVRRILIEQERESP